MAHAPHDKLLLKSETTVENWYLFALFWILEDGRVQTTRIDQVGEEGVHLVHIRLDGVFAQKWTYINCTPK